MLAPARTAVSNRLIDTLPIRDGTRLLAGCELTELGSGEVLCESGDRIGHVCFPLNSVISLVTALDDGEEMEVGIVGNEGMLGTSLVLGVNMALQRAVVQGAGGALRISAGAFERQLRETAALRQGMHRYVYVTMRQLAQTAACTRYHLIEARLARWLLLTRDRAHSNQFHITHEFLAYMLGVQRVGITRAARSLQDRGLIDCRRGQMAILDGAGLERSSCHCYRQGNDMYDLTLGGPSDRSHRH